MVIMSLSIPVFAQYLVGPGDELKIEVITAPEFSRTVIVRPDGKIDLPFINSIKVEGISLQELRKLLVHKFSKYLKNPIIEVAVKEFRSQIISVLGEVFRPGIYRISKPTTLVEAITMAGGYKSSAEIRNVIIVHKGLWVHKPEIKSINLYYILKKKKFSLDPYLKAGDVVYVPNSFTAKLGRFTDFFFSKIRPSLQFTLEAYDLKHLDQRYR